MLSFPGGWITDRFLGSKRAIVVGGLTMMIVMTRLRSRVLNASRKMRRRCEAQYAL
jgi:dipeptide/tripeptide permease